MRRLLESLTPDARLIYWNAAAGMFAGHESPRKLAQQPVTTVAVDGQQRSIGEVTAPLRQAARFD